MKDQEIYSSVTLFILRVKQGASGLGLHYEDLISVPSQRMEGLEGAGPGKNTVGLFIINYVTEGLYALLQFIWSL